MGDEAISENLNHEDNKSQKKVKVVYLCDRCGINMIEKNCKLECPN